MYEDHVWLIELNLKVYSVERIKLHVTRSETNCVCVCVRVCVYMQMKIMFTVSFKYDISKYVFLSPIMYPCKRMILVAELKTH